jgi:NADH-quinone oxidoreductase subunit K
METIIKYFVYSIPSLLHYLSLTTSLFFIGLCGIVSNRTNLLIILICIEVVLFSIDINFVIFSVYLDDICGQVFALFILTVAASESAIGLAIVVVYYRLQDNIVLPSIGLLRG